MKLKALPHGEMIKTIPTSHTAVNATVIGIRALNARATVGGTPSGILMVQSFLMMYPNTPTAKNPTIMAMKTPFAPVHARGILSTRNGSTPSSGENSVT